jgi:hypothetical protein
LGLFETEEAKKYADDVHRLITDGLIDGVDKNGRYLRNDKNGNTQVLNKSTGEWGPYNPDDEY